MAYQVHGALRDNAGLYRQMSMASESTGDFDRGFLERAARRILL